MRRLIGLIGLTAVLTALVVPGTASALDDVNTTKLRNAVTVGGILTHERNLQRIANENGGTRASGTSGYEASAAYVMKTLKAAGYSVKQQKFTFPFFKELAPPTLSQVTPAAASYTVVTMTYSGSGAVRGALVPAKTIAPTPGAPGSTSSGCTAGDFTPAPAGPAVALVQRGVCTFEVKAANAQAAGYDAVILFNEGQPGRTEALSGTLNRIFTLPVVGASFADGIALYNAATAGPVTVDLTTSTQADPAVITSNIIADSPGGNPDKVLVVGSHLDSVIAGPGINDNGSGTATNLEIAVQMAKLKITPKQKVRFAFWGGEELGLLGSDNYVTTLPAAQLSKIFANLNFDMLGSPNYVRFVYDGDGSGGGPVGPPGSAQLENLFTNYFAGKGLPSAPTAFNGRSDYGPFIAVGIPAGGLFSGAEGVKTAAEASTYGGTAGAAYDSCYHMACDTVNNLSTRSLDELGDAAAHAIGTLAMSRTGLYEDGSLRAAPYRAPQFDSKGSLYVR